MVTDGFPISSSNLAVDSGDSYSTTSTDFTSTKLSIVNPIGNPAWPGFTSDSDYNWINHLVGTYNISETLCWNFAYGGATTNSTLVHPYSTKVPDFSAQIDLFEQYVGVKPAIANWTTADSMFGAWLGVNDIGNSYTNTTADEAALISKIMTTYSSQLERLYGYGARNFITLNIPRKISNYQSSTRSNQSLLQPFKRPLRRLPSQQARPRTKPPPYQSSIPNLQT
jgi:phospholipase/lecithinase/hemolysin